MEKEVNAVNSEYLKNLKMDNWRMGAVQNLLTKKDHPINRFNIGNLKTLWEIPKLKNIIIRDEIVKFYKEYYSSDIMTLTVLGKESIDELSNKIIEFFSDIPKRRLDDFAQWLMTEGD